MKSDHDIEQLLRAERAYTLDAAEKDTIKSALLDHAAQSIKNDTPQRISLWHSWFMRGAVSVASLLMIFGGVGFSAHDSLPGEPLYAVKVHVMEELVELTKIDPESRIAYRLERMENRLEELQSLSALPDTVPNTAVSTLNTLIDTHVTEVTDTLATLDEETLPHTNRINILVDLGGISKAQSKVVQDTRALAILADTIEMAEERTADSIEDTVSQLLEDEATSTVFAFLGDQVEEIGSYVHATSTEEDSRMLVEDYLEDINGALEDKNTEAAVTSILEAQLEIESEEALKDAAEATSHES